MLALFARGGRNAEVREGIVGLYEDYVKRWGEQLRWSAEAETERYRKFDERAAEYPRRALGRDVGGEERKVMWVAYGGDHRHEANGWKFKGSLQDRFAAAHRLDFASATWPVGPAAPTPEELVALALDWARRLPVRYGYAGYSLGVSEEHKQLTAKTVYDLAMRFQGLEIHDPLCTALCCETQLKSVNWLTLVSNEMLTPRYTGPLIGHVGGMDVLRANLSPEIVLHPIRDGVLIQAGPEPLLGDVNRGETLPLYREVAKVLKPIRAETHWPFFGILTANDWMTRFDR
ncbi:MAG: DUF3396 domain-containing protein [Polyangiaceae bacterium]|nr:DUF3396 domain-containing protein [Polyangiaceae bacterium]